jgi:serine/threonine-protein kinase
MVRYHFKDRYQSAAEALESLRLLNNTYSPPTPYPAVPRTPSANDAPPLGQRVPPRPYPPSISEHQTLAASPAAPPRQPSTPPLTSPAGGTSDKTPLMVGIGMAIAVGAVGMAFALRDGSCHRTSVATELKWEIRPNGSCTVVSGGIKHPLRTQRLGRCHGSERYLSFSHWRRAKWWVEISTPKKGWVFNGSRYINCTLANQTPVETAQVNPKPIETTVSPKPVETTVVRDRLRLLSRNPQRPRQNRLITVPRR